MKIRPVLFLIASLVFISVPLALFAQNTESLTIATYYPSPYGSYAELRAKRMAIGDNYISTSNADWNASSGAANLVPADTDLIVEGNVGIGLINPATELEVFGTNPDGNGAANASIRVTSFYGTSPSGQYAGSFGGRAARGSKSSPAALQSGDAFSLFAGSGWTGSAWSEYSRAYMRFDAEENWSPTNQGARIQFNTTPAGGTSTAAAMVIKGDGKVGIGTMTPQATAINSRNFNLDVANNTITDDVYMRNPKSGAARWASEAGGAKVGTYTGNGVNNSSTQAINIGFRPKAVLITGASPTNGSDRLFFKTDDYSNWDNGVINSAGSSFTCVRIVDTGFEVKGDSGDINESGTTYYYIAFP